MPSEERIQRQRERAQHLIAIREFPSYPVLKEIVEQRVKRDMMKFIGTPVLSQQEIDFGRGFMFGLQTVIEIVENGEKQLEAAVRQAQALEGAEGA